MFNPAGYALGSGSYTDATHATLALQSTVTLSDGCTFLRHDTSNVTFVGMNHLQVDWNHTENSYGTSCTAATRRPPIRARASFASTSRCSRRPSPPSLALRLLYRKDGRKPCTHESRVSSTSDQGKAFARH
jgi:hypothetical protein